MANTDLFSLSTMLDALPHHHFFPARATINEEIPAFSPPPPPVFTASRTSEWQSSINSLRYATSLETRLQWMFNVMTSNDQDSAQNFKDLISELSRTELQMMASLLTSNSDYFLKIARNENGSKRLQKLLGKSDDVDAFFAATILRCFLHVMTDKHASYVAIRGMRVFDKDNKESIYEFILHHAIHLARDKHGCVALNEIITDVDDPYYRNQLLDIVVVNALFLSNDTYGNFVIQHVLKLYDLRCTLNIACNLGGHCVELSFKKYGSYIVERLLEAEEESMVVVVKELLECEGGRLMRLARSEYGNFVVSKALRATEKQNIRAYCSLVHNLIALSPSLAKVSWKQHCSNLGPIH